jgi:predicted phosphodiesterase
VTIRVAALYDIHGNLPALEAVLAEIGDVDLVLVGGDVVWGPWPQETMDLLRSLPRASFIMGNADRDVFTRKEGNWKAANDWCADRLSSEHLSFLRSMPPTVSIDGVLYCHGSPRNDTDHITLRTSESQILRWCKGLKERTVVCGHTHGQFQREVGDFRIVNAGSVGNPFGDPGAYWLMVGQGAEPRFTPYDTEATATAIRATGFPYGDVMASDIVSQSTADDAARFFS